MKLIFSLNKLLTPAGRNSVLFLHNEKDMTGRTHDLAAFTALTIAFIALPLPTMTVATAIVTFGANFIGGLFPDIDQPTGDLWDDFRGGEIAARFVTPFLGGHRHISHSLIGMLGLGFLLQKGLAMASTILLVDMTYVWWGFMLGVYSHILMDMFTRDGVPLLFPLQWKIGIPPFRFLRMKSGGILEKVVVFPGLLALNGYLLYINQAKLLEFLHHLFP